MSSSEEVVRQFSGIIPNMVTGQNAVAKTYVDEAFAALDADITTVAGSATAAQNSIDQHEVATAAHPATAITYSGNVLAYTVKEAIDKSSDRVEYFIANSGNSVAEIVNARDGQPQLNDRLNIFDTQLAGNTQQIKGIDVPYNYVGPVITFVDDDVTTTFITRMQPTLDTKGVKATLGAITSFVGTSGYMTKVQLTALQDAGHEIVSHTKTHAETVFKSSTHDLSLVTDAAIEAEYSESRQWLIDNGFAGYDTLVYPWGGFGSQAVRYKRLARKYYKNAINATGAHNGSPSDNMYLNRTFININQDFTTVLKPIIDAAVANNGWLIFGSHSSDTANFNGTYLATVIDYIQSLSVPILTFGQAQQLKGNALSVGEYTDINKSLYVGRDGAKSGIPMKVIEGAITSSSTRTMNDALSKYDLYTLTITHIQSDADTLSGHGGILETYNGGEYYGKQVFTNSVGVIYERNWSVAPSPGTWGVFRPLAINDQYRGVRLATDPITAYDNGEEYATIGATNSTIASFPESSAGVLFTYRVAAGDVYSYQEYKIRQSNKKYSRYWDITNAVWTAWVKISVV